MNTEATPETDAFVSRASCKNGKNVTDDFTKKELADFARTLERERDLYKAEAESLKTDVLEYCEDCGHPLSPCGAQDSDGEPTMDCVPCKLRTKLAAARAQVAGLRLMLCGNNEGASLISDLTETCQEQKRELETARAEVARLRAWKEAKERLDRIDEFDRPHEYQAAEQQLQEATAALGAQPEAGE